VESQQELSKPQRQDAKALPNVRSLPRLATEFLDQRSGRFVFHFVRAPQVTASPLVASPQAQLS